MRHGRSLTVSAVVALVAVVVLAADTLAGPPSPPPSPTVRSVGGEPVAGGSICSVGLGPVSTPFDLPEGAEASPDDVDASEDPDADDEVEEGDAEEPTDAEDDADADAEDDADTDDAEDDADADAEDADEPADAELDLDEVELLDADELPRPTLITARPGPTGAGPAALELELLADGDRTTSTLPDVFPGADVREAVGQTDAFGAAWLRWRERPVVSTREWRLEDVDELPAATVAGGCATASAEPHLVPGFSTSDGADARLRLSNPFGSAATVAVSFVTPTGEERPVGLRNLSVPARSVREVPINRTLPERDDLAARVEVVSGRVAVEGLQVTRAEVGGVDGATLLTSTVTPAEDWTIPWVADRAAADAPEGEDAPEDDDAAEGEDAPEDEDAAEDEDTPEEDDAPEDDDDGAPEDGDATDEEETRAERIADGAASWLWILNPNEGTASVELSYHTPDGGAVPEGLAEVSVAPGELRRIDLSGTLPDGVDEVGVTARSNGVPIVVSSGTHLTAEEPDDTGSTVQLGAQPDANWVVSGGTMRGRSEQLRIVNPGSSAAQLDIGLFNGVASIGPDELQELELAAGSATTVTLDEHLEDASGWTAFVTATGSEVAVSRLGHDLEGPLHLTAVPGIPSSTWSGDDSGLRGVFTDGLARQLRTGPGVDADLPLDDEDEPVEEDLPGFGDPDDLGDGS